MKLHNGASSSPWQYALTILNNQEDPPSFSGFGSRQDTPDRVLGALNLSGQKTTSSLYKANLSKTFSHGLKVGMKISHLELDSIFYQNTLNSISDGVVKNSFNLEEDRHSGEFEISQQLASWNSQWALIFGRSEHRITEYSQTLSDALTQTIISPQTDVRYPEFSYQGINNIAFEAKTHFFAKKLIFTYGARLDHYPTFDNQTSPRLSVIYHPDESSSFKIIYGDAFRAPIVAEKTGLNNIAGNPYLKPEEINSVELVYMKEGNNWKTELVYYHSQLDKGIAIASTESGLAYVNFSKQNAKGFEASFQYLGQKWSFMANLALADSENSTADNQKHTAYPGWLSNVDISYNFSAQSQIFLSTRMFGDYYLGDKISSPGPVEKADVYMRTDLQLSHQLNKKTSLWINVKNVFNNDNTYPSVWNAEGGIPDIKRLVSLGAKYDFY